MRLYFARKKATQRLEKKRTIKRYVEEALDMSRSNAMLLPSAAGSEAMPMTEKELKTYNRRMTGYVNPVVRWFKWLSAMIRWRSDCTFGIYYDPPKFRKP